MDNDEKPDNQWVADAIAQAKESALPMIAGPMAAEMGVELDDFIDAIELALMTLNGEPNEVGIREALRGLSEPYANAIGVGWESVADAIVGTLEWVQPDPASWTVNGWDKRGVCDPYKYFKKPK